MVTLSKQEHTVLPKFNQRVDTHELCLQVNHWENNDSLLHICYGTRGGETL